MDQEIRQVFKYHRTMKLPQYFFGCLNHDWQANYVAAKGFYVRKSDFTLKKMNNEGVFKGTIGVAKTS